MPAVGGSRGEPLLEFADVMRRLRAECPWKAEQTHASLARYLLEETHETLETLDTGDVEHLREELGDLLLQVFLHTAIAEEAGEFTLADVATEATAKMVRRNPHVFGDGSAGVLTPHQVNEQWEQRKAAEKQARSSVLDGIAPTLPGLLLADKVLDRLDRAGRLDLAQRDDDAARDDLAGRHGDRSPERSPPMTSEEMGARLLALVGRARLDGIDPEQALREAVRGLVEAAEG